MEEKRREIGEAAEGYAGHHWANWVPLAMWPVGIGWMWGAAWLVESGLRWAGISRESASGQSLFLKIFFPLAFAGILAFIIAFAIWYERWQKQKLGVKTKAEPRPQTVKQFFFMSLYCGFSTVIPRDICGHVPLRFAPLGFYLWCVLPVLLAMRMRWIPRVKGVRGLWRESPVVVVALATCGAYALATAAGLPQPWAGEASNCGYVLRVLAPFAVIFALSLIAGAFYSRYEFRRLQRLVSEEGTGDE